MIETCVDRPVLDGAQLEKAIELAIRENSRNAILARDPLGLAVVRGRKWKPGRLLRVKFLEGDSRLHDRVISAAKLWEKYANIHIEKSADADSEIRIRFQKDGSWSMIGTDCLSVARNQHTMNYGWLNVNSDDVTVRGVVLHEFGHALGFIHEHQNPSGGIQWNKPAVYAYYQGPPNNWDKATIDHNLFTTYSKEQTQFTQTDPKSIMMYPIAREFTLNGFQAGYNTTLSEMDKSFAREVYPFSADPVTPPVKPVDPVVTPPTTDTSKWWKILVDLLTQLLK